MGESVAASKFVDRKTEVSNRLTGLLRDLKEKKPYLEGIDISKNEDDVCTLYVEGKLEEIKRLKKQVDEYHHPDKHFTKQYRTLEGHCGKLQIDLDKVDVTGRDDLDSSRKVALLKIDKLLETLRKKAHDTGKTCHKCEVKN